MKRAVFVLGGLLVLGAAGLAVFVDAVLAEKERELRAWTREQGLTPTAAAMFAYYNDPLTPGFLRRNEVLIEVIADSFSREPQARAAD